MKLIERMRRMRLIALIGLLGLMGLMGCSRSTGDDLPEPPTPIPTPTPTPTPTDDDDDDEIEETAISFSSGIMENEVVTRATTPLSDTGINTFMVWGYKNMTYSDEKGYDQLQTVFPGYTVNWTNSSSGTTTSNSRSWEYVNQQTGSAPEQTIKYWDWGSSAYRFFGATASSGISTGSTDGAYEITMDDLDASSAEGIAAMPYFTQLWFSTGNISDYPTREYGKPVQLVFMKPYAKVRFMYNYVFPREGVILEHQSFKPSDGTSKIARKGSVKVSYPLTGKETKESYTITPNSSLDLNVSKALTEFTEDCDPEDDTKTYTVADAEGWYTVLPINSQGSYTLTVDVNSATKTSTVPAAFMTWLPGYSYTYIFKINEEGGVEIDMVQSAFTEWTPIKTSHDVFNW